MNAAKSLSRAFPAALLAVAAVLAACRGAGFPGPVSPASAASPAPEGGWAATGQAARRLPYLALSYRGLYRFEREKLEPMDTGRHAKGALAAAALAAAGEPGSAADALRWTKTCLDECRGRWFKCQGAQLSLQRLALQYPEVLTPVLLRRLRAEVAPGAPPPGPAEVADPWDFAETENQRMTQAARSLVGEVVAGTPGSPAARAWGEYLEAFLLAHDRDGWYEGDSPGYMAVSITALLHLHDHAPQPAVRALAKRQLDLLFAGWAQEQAAGFPAGAKSRTYVHWALGAVNTPWQAWAWLIAGMGAPEAINFADAPQLAASAYEVPAPVARLLAERRLQPPYEIERRRRFELEKRNSIDAALYSYATPDYILSAAQSVAGLDFGVSGGQEIVATLYPEGPAEPAGAEEPEFAPVYLWSRNENPRSARWKSWVEQDLAVADRNVALARLGKGDEAGYAYLAPAWARPEPAGEEAVVSRYGDTYVALVTEGGWEVAPAPERFPGYFGGDPVFRDAWVAVPRRQPASIALLAGRRAEDGDFAAWKERAAGARLTVEAGEISFTGTGGERFSFLPGVRAAAGGRPLDPRGYPLLGGPFLAAEGPGRWRFALGDLRYRFEELGTVPVAERTEGGGKSR